MKEATLQLMPQKCDDSQQMSVSQLYANKLDKLEVDKFPGHKPESPNN